jgi:murein DD-endopeptidase MepM/ murein hydrolase activator NlpD
MRRIIQEINMDLHMEEVHQQIILASIERQQKRLTHIPSIWPTSGRFSSPFGYRRSPFTGRRTFHKGIDITASRGSPIYAPAAGKVTYAQRFSTYGLCVEVEHGAGIMTRFAHLSGFAVDVGQTVARGDMLGYVGNTGRSTAPHLHYEVHVKKKLVNPLNYILN